MKSKRFLATAACCGSLCATAVHAAPELFLRLGDIDGEASARGHENWIDLQSFGWSVSATPAAGGGGAGTGRVQSAPLRWTQSLDASVPGQFAAVAAGRRLPAATLEAVHPGPALSEPFLRITLSDVLLTRLDLGADESFERAVSGELSFGRMELAYRPQQADGGLGAPLLASWDFSRNAPLFQGDAAALAGWARAGAAGGFALASPVPESSSALLLLAGLGLAAAARRHRTARRA